MLSCWHSQRITVLRINGQRTSYMRQIGAVGNSDTSKYAIVLFQLWRCPVRVLRRKLEHVSADEYFNALHATPKTACPTFAEQNEFFKTEFISFNLPAAKRARLVSRYAVYTVSAFLNEMNALFLRCLMHPSPLCPVPPQKHPKLLCRRDTDG